MAGPRAIRGRTIVTPADVRRGARALAGACPHMRRVHATTGDPPLRRDPPGFEGLARIVVGQQVSAASANAIWQRTAAVVRPFTPARLLDLSDGELRGAGLSRPKVRTLRCVAAAITEGALDLATLGNAPDVEIREALMEVSGIGPWTADIYLMFCLGRADSWASGDLALQLSTQSVLGLTQRPSPAELEAIAERWRPWRGIAARLLWAYYALPEAARIPALRRVPRKS